MMKFKEFNTGDSKGLNVFLLVVVSSILYLFININFYSVKSSINYFELFANVILLMTTFYLIYVTQKNSTNKSGFYYYTSIGFTFLFFGLYLLTLDHIYIYQESIVSIVVKLLFVFGYSLLAIGVTKWVKYNELRQDELSVQANTDELTGILNRRSFTRFLDFQFDTDKGNSSRFSLVIIDIDFFKSINDNHGHLIGDEVLKSFSKQLKKSFRSADKVCRWGGEEFAILLPNTTLENALTVAEKIRHKVEHQPFKYDQMYIKYTISLGASELLNTDKSVDDVIGRADEALYMAKNSNRNCVRSVQV